MGGDPLHLAGGAVHRPGAAVNGRVGVEDLHVLLYLGTAEAVIIIGVGIEIDGAQQFLAGFVPAEEHHHIVLVVVGHQPLKALPAVVVLPQGALTQIEVVQVPDILMELPVALAVQHAPVQLVLEVPFLFGAQLHAHKAQLLSGMGHGVAVKAPDARQLLPLVPGHLAPDGALHVDHLVVAQGQDVVFRKSVEHGEGDVLVVALAEPGVHFQIVAHVIHPAHVPLQVEAQTADAVGPDDVCGLGHQRPGRRFLGHHQHVGIDNESSFVQLLEESDGFQILLAPVLVGDPLAVPAVIIQIQHGSNRIHPDAVDVVFLQPESGGGEQEALHLRAAVVEDPGAPGGVFPLSRVGVLVAGGAVELIEAVGVLAKVGGYPV